MDNVLSRGSKDDYSNSSLPDGVLDARVVERMHIRADTDSTKESIHHTIGTASTQAASGNHNHKGVDSVVLLSGVSLTGTRGTATAIPSIIAALVALGAVDNTTA